MSAWNNYDSWKTTDVQADRDAYLEDRLSNLSQRIRNRIDASGYIEEIQCDSSLDDECNKAIELLFCGINPVENAKILAKFANEWLDKKAYELALEEMDD